MTLLLATTIKITIVLLAALAALRLRRGESAETRHWILATAVVCALLVPVLAPILPSWMPPLRPEAPQVDIQTEFSATGQSSAAMGVTPQASGRLSSPVAAAGMIATLISVWIVGAAFALGALALGLARLAVIARRARPIGSRRCTEMAQRIAHEHGVRRRVRVLGGVHPAMLVTWGLARPTVILPRAAATWSDERLRVVLCHEFAHIRRGDWVTQLAAELLRALQWFNPVAWLVCRRLRQESEHACDDSVLNAGVTASAYATHLLDLARAHSGGRAAWAPALPVARPSGLERRVRAMLDPSLNRHPLTRRTRLATIALFLALAGPVAGAALFAQGPFATVAGSLSDSMRGVLPGATLVMTNLTNQAKNEVRSDGSGRYEFVGLPPGDYVLEVSLPGFRKHRAALSLNGEQVDRDVVMDVSAVQEEITVTDDDRPPRVVTAEELQAIEQRRLKRAAAVCPQGGWPGDTGGVAVGGNIRPPAKLRDVRPEYPPALKAAKIGGTVNIEARIATDGTVVDMRADPSAHPDLARAAMDAVREWRFDETLLNCMPIEVTMNVSVSFRPRQG